MSLPSQAGSRMDAIFPGRLGLIQRVKPSYRVPFFDRLAQRCEGGLCLCAGRPLPVEAIPQDRMPGVAKWHEVQNRHFSDPSSAVYLCYQAGLLGAVQEWNPAALILEANYRYLSSYRVMAWARRKGIPVVGWGLGSRKLPFPLGQIRDRFIQGFDALVSYSEQGAAEYAALGFDRRKILVAKNAVTDAPTEAAPVRHAIGPTRVLFVGRLQARKRVDLLIRALAAIGEGPHTELVVVGDGPEREALQSLASSIYPLTRFTGHLEGEPLAQEFREADLFVLPGTGGLAIQQAMSYALPLIVAEGDGSQNDLVTEKNGWYILPGDETDLVAKLRLALSNRVKLAQMGAESYRIVREEVNITKMADVFIQALSIAKEAYEK